MKFRVKLFPILYHYKRVANLEDSTGDFKGSIHVDVSNTGWEINSHLVTTSEFWTKEETQQSINVGELKTILFVIQRHTKECENSTIKIFFDSITALKYSTKSGEQYH
jgi:hypothetical protein